MNWSGKKVLLGVTGGIAAYKSATLLRDFQKSGAEVRVTMTPSALHFIGTQTFATLTRHEVAVEIFNDSDPGHSWTKHIHWGEWAEIFIIAPCTANTLAKLVHGHADNILTSIALAARCPILICPTMDAEMINHPAVKRNLELADKSGYYVLGPDTGYLASGIEGTGRLPEPDTILKKTAEILEENRLKGSLTKKKVLVTAGPTREHIDPVRFISNPSSGKMGIALAEAAHNLGADVTLLHGPVPAVTMPDYINSHPFESAEDLFELVQNHSDAEVVIMAAAVADFKPARRSDQKTKKTEGPPTLELIPNPDSLDWLGKQKKENQVLIGFAMETENLEENARRKLAEKNLDWICANDLTGDLSGFEHDTNHVVLFGKDVREEYQGMKKTIAIQILRRIFSKGE